MNENYTHSFLKEGWVCPKCGRVYAPFVTQCDYCSKTNFTTWTEINTGTGAKTIFPTAITTDATIEK